MSALNFDNMDLENLFADFGDKTDGITNPQEESGITAKPQATAPKIQGKLKGVDTTLLQSAQAHIQQISIELNNLFVERDDLVKIMMLAITTGTNVLMLGMPGTAKSDITNELCSRIENANYFSWLLNKTSDPSEILGSFSIKQMENDKFLRITTGKLPEAHIAFMDEVYKSNAPTLNALLTIMNEHIFYNDGKPNKIPLISLFGASNEPPEDETLNALHDRFIFRINVQYVKDASNKKRMHNNYIDKRAGLLGLAGKTTITLQELQELQKATMTVKVHKDIINKFISLINQLDKQAIHVSDRRQNECFKVLQGSAVLRGANAVGLDDFKSLIYVLWEKEEQIPIIESAIMKMVNPFDDRFNEIKENFNQIKSDIDGCSDQQQKMQKSLESKSNIEKLVSKVNKVINEASKNGKDATDFITFRDSMVAYNQELIKEALGTSFV